MVKGNLIIKPICAQLTRDTEFAGKMDPFVVLKLGNKSFQTKTDQDAGANPSWVGQEFITKIEDEEILIVEVWDEDTIGNDFVGSASIAVTQFINQKTTEINCQISYEGKKAGTVQFIFQWNGQLQKNQENQEKFQDNQEKVRNQQEEAEQQLKDLEITKTIIPIKLKINSLNRTNCDDAFHLIQKIDDINWKPKIIKIKLKWNDQGWGNQKGAFKISLMRNGQSIIEKEPFGIAPHQKKSEEIDFNSDNDIIHNFQLGDQYHFYFRVGGGGGHQLHIEDLECTFKPDHESKQEPIIITNSIE